MSEDPVVAMFNHPMFRQGWFEHVAKTPWSEEQCANVVYIYGRLMAAECRYPVPPRQSQWRTQEMVDVINRCPAFMKQLATYQLLAAGSDPATWTDEVGITQGDKNT